ncbi:DUF421 domain-containing protein [Anaerobacillus sp. HL2]|nr:DUF421 domain-containing protein [Anaerobacillus sp. HL2]
MSLIIEGRIQKGNLALIDKDEKWLHSKLKKRALKVISRSIMLT